MASGLPAGAAYVELYPRLAQGFAGDVEKQLKPALSRIGGNLTKVGGDLTRKVTLPIVAGFGVGLVKSNELAKGIAEVVTLTGEVGPAADKTFAQFKGGVRDLSGELGIAQGVLTKGLYQALSSGVPRENVFQFLEVAGKAAIGGVTDTETAVDGLSTVINAFGLSSDDAGRVADSLFTTVKGGKTTFKQLSDSLFQVAPLASAAGVGFEEVNAAMAALTVQGTPTAVATTQVRAALQGLLKPSAELDKIYQDAGYKNAADALEQDLGGALDIVRDATGGNIGELTKLVGSMEGVQAILGLTGDNSARFTGELDKQAKSVGALDDAFGEVDKHRSLDRLKVTGENLAIAFGDALLPTLTDLADKIVPLLNKFGDLDSGQQKMIVGAGLAVAALGPLLTVLGNVTKAVGGLGRGVRGAASGLGTLLGVGDKTSPFVLGWRKASSALETVRLKALYAKDGVVNMAKGIGSAVANGARAFASLVANAARATASVVASIARQVASWVVMGAQSLIHAAKVAAAWVISMGPIALVIAAVVALVVAIVKNWDSIKAAIGAAAEWVKAKLAAAWGAIKTAASAAWSFIKGVIAGGLNFIKTLFLNFTGPGLLIKHWDKIKDTAAGVVRFLKDRFNDFVGFFKGIPGKISAAARGMFNFLKEGMGNALNGVIGLWNRVDLGIHLDFKLPGWVPGVGGKGFSVDIDDIFPDIGLLKFHAGGQVPGDPGQVVGALLKAGERVSTPGQDRRGALGDKLADRIIFNGIDRPRAVVDELAWMMATK
jgi:TP901 family phage tail tape measure protein